ncbi:hypothetical protein BH11PSE2_BH11PSE2_10490 [soil metagenome]
MRFWRSLAAVLAVAACGLSGGALAQAPAAKVKALFVGIDHYVGSDSAAKIDLKGPRNDVELMQAALRAGGLLNADAYDSSGKACPATAGVSVATSLTLVDGCATRQAIIAAWTSLVANSSPGDTLLFYYSGHGSHTASGAEEEGGQPISTIVPTDARGANGKGDITGLQMAMLIRAATDRGRNVVTIFDSCESGGATRDVARPGLGSARDIPPPPISAPPPHDPDLTALGAIPIGPPGYRVHLAAARREEVARESFWRGAGKAAAIDDKATAADGAWHGDFTVALAAALRAHEITTYFDLAVETEAWLAGKQAATTRAAQDRQHPQREGDGLLGNFLQSGASGGRIYQARWTGDKLAAVVGPADGSDAPTEVGASGGVTAGSTYAVFRTAGAALQNRDPVGQASVDAGAQAFRAPMTPDTATAALRGEPTLWLREKDHVFGGVVLSIAITGADQTRKTSVRAALAAMGAVAPVDMARAEFELELGEAGHSALWKVASGQRGARAVDIDKIEAVNPDARIIEAVRRVANYRQLLNLPTTAREAFGGVWLQTPCDIKGGSSDCGDVTTFGRSSVRSAGPAAAGCVPGALSGHDSETGAKPGEAQIPKGTAFAIYVRNLTCQDLHPYIFYLGDDYSVTLLYPPPFASDLILRKKTQLVRSGRGLEPTLADQAEPGRILLIMSDTPIPAEVLQQSGLPRGIGCEGSALAHLLCAARTGTREVASNVANLGQWDVAVVSVVVK